MAIRHLELSVDSTHMSGQVDARTSRQRAGPERKPMKKHVKLGDRRISGETIAESIKPSTRAVIAGLSENPLELRNGHPRSANDYALAPLRITA